MTFLCNTKLFPLQPEIKYMSMETIYLGIVIATAKGEGTVAI